MTESYRLGDRVELKGSVKTFSGVPLQDIPVTYTITRSLYTWRMWGMNPVILASDAVHLGVDGNFEIPVDLKPDTSNPDLGDGDNTSLYYDYKVQLSVTNVAGETQTSETSLRAGKTSLLLFADISGLICKDDSVKATFRVNNLDRKPVSVEGSYRLFLISDYQKSNP